MTAGLLIAGVLIFAMTVAGVWLMQRTQRQNPLPAPSGERPTRPRSKRLETAFLMPRSSILIDKP